MKKELFAVDKNDKIKHWIVETDGADVVVHHGRYNGKMQTKRTTCKAKNVGRANETTPIEQAILEAEAKYTKQIDKCYRGTIEEAREVGQVLPMLAHNFLDHGHRISFPCYVSAKLDGVRCIATVDGTSVMLNSRGGKEYPCPEHIYDELVHLSYLTGITKFDGELYIHGTKLQHIVSAVKKPNEMTPKLVYSVFDLPSKLGWSKRWELLKDLKKQRLESVQVVDCVLVSNKAAAEVMLGQYMGQGYEGLMLRNIDGKYEYNHRSADLQKWKLMQDLEAKVVDVVEDKNGEGVLICEFKSDKSYLQFKCKMRGTHEERLYAEQKKLIDSWITVIYQQFTEDGIPQFPVGAGVRECDDEGNPIV